jgi:hypothetical protein
MQTGLFAPKSSSRATMRYLRMVAMLIKTGFVVNIAVLAYTLPYLLVDIA